MPEVTCCALSPLNVRGALGSCQLTGIPGAFALAVLREVFGALGQKVAVQLPDMVLGGLD